MSFEGKTADHKAAFTDEASPEYQARVENEYSSLAADYYSTANKRERYRKEGTLTPELEKEMDQMVKESYTAMQKAGGSLEDGKREELRSAAESGAHVTEGRNY